MANTVEVDPEQLRTAGQQAAAIQDRIQGVIGALQSAIAARGEPWGDDSIGQQFADGANGYLKARDNMIGGAGQFATSFTHYGGSEVRTANKLESEDHSNADVFVDVDG